MDDRVLTKRGFAVLRKADGREWLDTSTFSGDRETTERLAHDAERRIPGWANANPVTCVAQVEMRVLDREPL